MAEQPSVSIVIAAWPTLAGLEDCLEALCGQRDSSTECIVVSSVFPSQELRERFPWVCWSQAASNSLIPHLWGSGMAKSRGEIIAITTAHFTPAPDWIVALRQAHARWECWAVGGRIDPPRRGGPVSWAIYFLRYSAYLAYRQEQLVPDVAGDNASYKRVAFKSFPNLLRDGFWELDLHRRLSAEGRAPVFVPGIRVTQRHSFGFWCFLSQRFRHGKQFGRSRGKRWVTVLRLGAAIAFPVIPALFLSKIVLRVVRSGQHIGRLLSALPALVCFLLAWAAGEACGYLVGANSATAQRLQAESDSSLAAFDPAASAEVPSCP
jgi:hypothetical protein